VPSPVTTKLAESIVLLVVSRVAMAAAIPVGGLLLWFTINWLDTRFSQIDAIQTQISGRVRMLEERAEKYQSQIQDHESRLTFGKAKRDSEAQAVQVQIKTITDKLDSFNSTLNIINGNIIGLQTTINERVPARQGMLTPRGQ
jgi:peptidoglycan hydrolase CwlO-like protein